MKLLLLAFALGASVAYGIVCPNDICARVRCAGIRDEDCAGKVVPNGGFCKCCPACIKQIAEGEQCMSPLLLLGVPQNSQCEDDLFCNRNSGKCERKTCASKLKEFKDLSVAAEQNGHRLIGQSEPRCEDDGTFSPVQCSGSVCYCVSKEGDKLFRDKPNDLQYSAHIWEQKGMNCGCAVKQHEYMKTGLIGRLFSCSTNGNYAKVGCTGSVCYCVDENGKQIGKNGVNISQRDSLNC